MPSRDPLAEPKRGTEIEDRSSRIARDGPATAWRQIADDIIAQIDSGKLPPHTRLPNENDLAEMYGVARDTLRNAKKHLIEEGYIEVTQGLGTFVRAERRKRRTT